MERAAWRAKRRRSGVQVGPLVNEETRRKVRSLVEDTVARGGSRLAATVSPRALARRLFRAPTQRLDVTEAMPVCREEVSATAAPAVTFESEEEAICRASDAPRPRCVRYPRVLGWIVRLAGRFEYGLGGVPVRRL